MRRISLIICLMLAVVLCWGSTKPPYQGVKILGTADATDGKLDLGMANGANFIQIENRSVYYLYYACYHNPGGVWTRKFPEDPALADTVIPLAPGATVKLNNAGDVKVITYHRTAVADTIIIGWRED